MKVSKADASRHRLALLRAASIQIREVGLGGINVVQLAKSAGLTHGALYSHFASKDELLAEACAMAFADTGRRWADASLADFIAHYLSKEHRDNPGQGCPMAALISDAGRSTSDIGPQFTAGIEQLIQLLIDRAGPQGEESGDRRRASLTGIAAMFGALTIARAIGWQNPDLSDAFLSTVRAFMETSFVAKAAGEEAAAPDGP